jgi:phthalate 4,5-dioxygenase oxygenase subunit
MLTKEQNERMCKVEGDAPMGQVMRRHWMPACLSEEVADKDGAPVKVRLLGENLLAFRDSEGRVGLIDELCPHRRASLIYGRNEEGGLRCLYHGWKLDTEGRVIDMPSEPPASELKHKVNHKAYPTREWAGVVWTYLGPADSIPEFQPPQWAPRADTKVSIVKIVIPCNWAQILEGAIDSAHSSNLHSSDMVPARVDSAKATAVNWLRPSTDKAPRLQTQTTPYGFRYAAIRRPISGADQNDYVRVTVFVAPFTVLIPPNDSYNVANVNVPIDDTHTAFHFIGWSDDPAQLPDTETWRKFLSAQVGVDLNDDYTMRRSSDNRFLQDRAAMKAGNFTGISGIPNQDIAMWTTMGPIADREHDILGASDVAIVEFRRQMAAAAEEIGGGAPAIGTGSMRVPTGVRSYQRILPKTTDWRTVEAG